VSVPCSAERSLEPPFSSGIAGTRRYVAQVFYAFNNRVIDHRFLKGRYLNQELVNKGFAKVVWSQALGKERAGTPGAHSSTHPSPELHKQSSSPTMQQAPVFPGGAAGDLPWVFRSLARDHRGCCRSLRRAFVLGAPTRE
jgi:hypothetical protein